MLVYCIFPKHIFIGLEYMEMSELLHRGAKAMTELITNISQGKGTQGKVQPECVVVPESNKKYTYTHGDWGVSM